MDQGEVEAAPDDFFRPISAEGNGEISGLEDDLVPLAGPSTSSPAAAMAPGLDPTQLRTAPQSRRLRSAMHRAAASTAASLSSENAFGSAFDPKRFEAGSTGVAVDRSMDRAADMVEVIPGLRLENVVLSAGYSSNGIPGSGFNAFNQRIGSDYDMGAQATFAYRNTGRSSSLNFSYRPTHIQRARLSEWNTTNHELTLSTTKDIGRRWTFGSGITAVETGLEQAFIDPAVFSTLNNVPRTFDELIQQVESGQLTDDQFASALTGTPVVAKPAERHLNLSRGLILASFGSVSYAYSPRTTLRLNGRLTRFQMRRDQGLAQQQLNNPFYFRQIFSKGFTGELDYKLSGRRSIGAIYTEGFRGDAGPYGSRRDTSAQFSFREQLGRSWSYTLRAGVGAIGGAGNLLLNPNDPSGQLIAPSVQASRTTTWVGSGSLNYRLGSQRFSFSAGRRVGNTFNFGNRAAITARVNWNWEPRRTPWRVRAGGSFFQSNTDNVLNGIRGFQSRQVSAGFSRTLTPSTAFSTDFQFGYFQTPYIGLFTNNSIRRVQMSFIWRPDPTER